MDFFSEILKDLAGDKTLQSVQQFLAGETDHIQIDQRSLIFTLVVFGIIIFFSITESVARRGQRDRSMKECWNGKNRALAAFLALVPGFLGVHRFYLRYYLTGILQIIGTVIFIIGAFLLGKATVVDFLLMRGNVSLGLMLLMSGLLLELWHFSDFFMILFGGMIPKRRKHRDAPPEPGKPDISMYARPVERQVNQVPNMNSRPSNTVERSVKSENSGSTYAKPSAASQGTYRIQSTQQQGNSAGSASSQNAGNTDSEGRTVFRRRFPVPDLKI